MKIVYRLIAFAAILASIQSLAMAQGPRRGFTATDLDLPGGGGNVVYRINLDNPQATVAVGITGVDQELEGFLSIGPRLFGVAETPDTTSIGVPSNFVDITSPATNPNGVGTEIGLTGINFGTEAGSAYDPTTQTVYSIHSDDQNRTDPNTGQVYPATALYIIDPSTGAATAQLSIAQGRYLDGLAVGADGTLYASDARLTDSLYRYNFATNQWVLVGSFGVALNEDSGLASYISGGATTLYLLTEGENALLGRLWTVSTTNGALTPVNGPNGTNNLLLTNGAEVPEDIEGFDIPSVLLVGE
jgi:hypothetical protein